MRETANPERFATGRAFESWMRRHHANCDGVWLLIGKAGAQAQTITYAEAVEVALCYGWVDGQKKPLDAEHWQQRFTPRRPRSTWSKINREKVEALTAAGRMRPAGVREIERAKADGRWDAAYDGQATMRVPDDLQRELDARPAAAAFFAGLDSRNRYAILFRLHDAKKPETRARRLEKFVAMLEACETIHPPSKRRA